MVRAEIVVRFTSEGFHYWPEAKGSRDYLAHLHRHLFHVEAAIEVRHDDREIEFHDLLAFCRGQFPTGMLGASSCEQLARNLLESMTRQYPDRRARVSVFEDGEVGAMLQEVPGR